MKTTNDDDGDNNEEEDVKIHLAAAVHIQLLKSRAVSANLKHYYDSYNNDD